MADTHTSSGLPFMKMHGAGNDFVVVDARRSDTRVSAELARALADRHRGVGFDQLAEIIGPEHGEDAVLRFWNADGTEAAACGNATRCVAEHLLSETGKSELSIRTERGVLRAEQGPEGTRVNMGQPIHKWQDIPLAEAVDTDRLPLAGSPSAVGMGNPHCIFFVEDIASIDVAERGAALEHHPLFPQATNVEFVQVNAVDSIRMRVWERGTGITLACGSGACAAVVAATRRGLTNRRVEVELDGGTLGIEFGEEGVWMSGPTVHVFDGNLTPEFLQGVG